MQKKKKNSLSTEIEDMKEEPHGKSGIEEYNQNTELSGWLAQQQTTGNLGRFSGRKTGQGRVPGLNDRGGSLT